MTITIGRIVHYVLTEADAATINAIRHAAPGALIGDPAPGPQGNPVAPGEVLPAIVVRVWGPECVNLQVWLDGNDSLWKTSATQASSPDVNEPGCWDWPPRDDFSKAMEPEQDELQQEFERGLAGEGPTRRLEDAAALLQQRIRCRLVPDRGDRKSVV